MSVNEMTDATGDSKRRIPSVGKSRAPGRLLHVTAERLYTGIGEGVIRAGAVLVDGERIVAVGPEADVPCPRSAEVHRFDGATLLPGLIDAHVHLCFANGEDLVASPRTTPERVARQRAVHAARLVLHAGVTTVRDLGCRGRIAQQLRDEIAAGRVEGPRVVASGRPITSPKGHFWSFGIEVRGAEEARSATMQLVAEKADVVKLIATGGALTPGTPMGRAQFDIDEVTAVTTAARSHGLAVAAHAHGTEGIVRVVEAGVDTIEHCSWMDPEAAVGTPDDRVLKRMIDNGQMIVVAGPLPEVVAQCLGGKQPAQIADVDMARRARSVALWRNARHARYLGVGVALGSDSLFGQFADGRDLAYRAQALVEVGGWEPLEVLQMVTSAGARALNAVGEIGALTPGALADMLAVSGNPTTDVADLHRVQAVFLAGLHVS